MKRNNVFWAIPMVTSVAALAFLGLGASVSVDATTEGNPEHNERRVVTQPVAEETVKERQGGRSSYRQFRTDVRGIQLFASYSTNAETPVVAIGSLDDDGTPRQLLAIIINGDVEMRQYSSHPDLMVVEMRSHRNDYDLIIVADRPGVHPMWLLEYKDKTIRPASDEAMEWYEEHLDVEVVMEK